MFVSEQVDKSGRLSHPALCSAIYRVAIAAALQDGAQLAFRPGEGIWSTEATAFDAARIVVDIVDTANELLGVI